MKHRKNQRLKGFDYSQEEIYFVTAITCKKTHYFGRISQGKMYYSVPGEIAREQWSWLKDQYPYLELHEFVVMPNHVHALIQICHSVNERSPGQNISEVSIKDDVPEVLLKRKSLSGIMGAYKTTVSKKIHLAGYPDFKWHRSFHDHIIRNERAFDNISDYIVSNPERWDRDVFNS